MQSTGQPNATWTSHVTILDKDREALFRMKRQEQLHKQWLAQGAAVRLQELRIEMEEIFRTFPQLRSQKTAPRVLTASSAGRPKRTISAAGKRAMSRGMREYWAKRKAREAKDARHTG